MASPPAPLPADSAQPITKLPNIPPADTASTSDDFMKADSVAKLDPKSNQHDRRNFFSLGAYQILMRIGWIFKTESVIMPAVMDMLCGPGTALAAYMRSWLPQLNRFGQSIPQLLFADSIRSTAIKKRVVAGCSCLMGLVFLILAVLFSFSDHQNPWVFRAAFLFLYAVFFVCVGVNNLAFNTLQGKLVVYDFRGRLFLFANLMGGLGAITAAVILLQRWLESPSTGFVYVFGFAGFCFFLGGLIAYSLVEQPDRNGKRRSRLRAFLLPAFRTVRDDSQFRKLAIIAACFGCSMMLFPHYQALYRKAVLGNADAFSTTDLLQWLIAQNLGTVLFSLAAGPLADRVGNRFVLRVFLIMLCLAPAAGLFLARYPSYAGNYFWVVFLLLGLTPVILRLLNNFSLEMAPADEHPKYLSVLSICIAIPVILLSQVAGWFLPLVGYDVVFGVLIGILLIGWLLTFSIHEPRHRLTLAETVDDN